MYHWAPALSLHAKVLFGLKRLCRIDWHQSLLEEKQVTETLNRPQAITKIAEMIKDIRIAMLSTVSPEGTIHSRPMATQEVEFRGELLFLTRQESSKTDEIAHDARVTLNYVDSKTYRFVTLAGHAALSKDPAAIHELWNPLYKAWFPNGENDPEITVIRVNVDQAEYWEAPGNAVMRGYQLLKAAVTKGGSPVGEHQAVAL
jgi:general stress protein 26